MFLGKKNSFGTLALQGNVTDEREKEGGKNFF
jgi:hypothetical protein